MTDKEQKVATLIENWDPNEFPFILNLLGEIPDYSNVQGIKKLFSTRGTEIQQRLLDPSNLEKITYTQLNNFRLSQIQQGTYDSKWVSALERRIDYILTLPEWTIQNILEGVLYNIMFDCESSTTDKCSKLKQNLDNSMNVVLKFFQLMRRNQFKLEHRTDFIYNMLLILKFENNKVFEFLDNFIVNNSDLEVEKWFLETNGYWPDNIKTKYKQKKESRILYPPNETSLGLFNMILNQLLNPIWKESRISRNLHWMYDGMIRDVDAIQNVDKDIREYTKKLINRKRLLYDLTKQVVSNIGILNADTPIILPDSVLNTDYHNQLKKKVSQYQTECQTDPITSPKDIPDDMKKSFRDVKNALNMDLIIVMYICQMVELSYVDTMARAYDLEAYKSIVDILFKKSTFFNKIKFILLKVPALTVIELFIILQYILVGIAIKRGIKLPELLLWTVCASCGWSVTHLGSPYYTKLFGVYMSTDIFTHPISKMGLNSIMLLHAGCICDASSKYKDEKHIYDISCGMIGMSIVLYFILLLDVTKREPPNQSTVVV